MFLLYYFVFINKNKSKLKITFFLGLIFTYLTLYFINMNFIVSELIPAVKTFYFPIMFLIFFGIFEEEDTFFDRKYLLISIFIYSMIIILGYATKTGFNSYEIAKTGTAGYFYAANEIGGIMAILLPFVFGFVFNKINISKILYFIFIISAILILGTKTPFISLMICTIYFVIKAINKKNIIKIILASLVSVIILSIIIVKTPIYKNLIIHAKYLGADNVVEIIKQPQLLDHFLLGSRLKFLENDAKIYETTTINNKLLGIGYLKNTKLVEMDCFDIYYRQGLIGFIIYFVSILYLLLGKARKYNKDCLLSILLILLIAAIVGHIITAPSVSTFVCYILYGFKKEVI